MLFMFSGFSTKYLRSENMNDADYTQANIVRNGPREQKYIALTFDDGPHPQYTTEILDLLKKHNIKATFFVLGQLAEKYPDIIKRQVNEGHEVGNHTYSHFDITKISKDEFKEEFRRTQDIISSLTGVESNVFRPPYGLYNENVVKIINEQQSNIILWTYDQDSKDWSNPGVDKIVDTTVANIKNGDIILFHDYVYHETSNTVSALESIIPELINKGYNFVTVSELMDLLKKDIVNN
ncbi:MAG: polysaccharide deacetylase family protein [Tissierella sp.]|nr:polysaccharide deacetylase family protein [Tissierella sp.]